MNKNQFDAHKMFGEFIEMLIDYFRIFGEKPCCAKDIVLFLDDLKDEQKPELASKLIQLCNISATTLPQTVSELFGNFLGNSSENCLKYSKYSKYSMKSFLQSFLKLI